ncbi:MAG: hypothetical protein AAFZ38_12555 [Myxococcota bacterium]
MADSIPILRVCVAVALGVIEDTLAKWERISEESRPSFDSAADRLSQAF